MISPAVRLLALAFLALALFGLSACAHLDRAVKSPEVLLEEVRLDSLSLSRQRFSVDMQVSNPNDFRLRARELTYHLTLEGVDLTRGVFDEGINLSAGGSEQLTVQVETDLLSTGRGLLEWLRSGSRDEINYRIEGELRPRSVWVGDIPYRHSGTVRFQE